MSLAGIPPLDAHSLQPLVLNYIVTRFPDRKWLWVDDEAVAFSSCVMWLVDTMHFSMKRMDRVSDCCENEPYCWAPKATLLPYLLLISKRPLCAASLHGILSTIVLFL